MYKLIRIKKPTDVELRLKTIGGYSDYNSALMFRIANNDFEIVFKGNYDDAVKKQVDLIFIYTDYHFEIFDKNTDEILTDNFKFYRNTK